MVIITKHTKCNEIIGIRDLVLAYLLFPRYYFPSTTAAKPSVRPRNKEYSLDK